MTPKVLMGCLLLAISSIHPQALEEEFCGVRLVVITDDGLPIPSTTAELRDASGQLVSRTQVKNGKAEFCDFGFGLHSILIGGGGCAAVELKNVRLRFKLPQTFKVVMNLCSQYGDQGSACFAYIRVFSETGAPLASVDIASESQLDRVSTDAYGRAMLAVRIGATDTFVFRKNYYQPEKLDLSCDAFKSTQEFGVVLKRLK